MGTGRIKAAVGNTTAVTIFNNGGGHWNHAFFWKVSFADLCQHGAYVRSCVLDVRLMRQTGLRLCCFYPCMLAAFICCWSIAQAPTQTNTFKHLRFPSSTSKVWAPPLIQQYQDYPLHVQGIHVHDDNPADHVPGQRLRRAIRQPEQCHHPRLWVPRRHVRPVQQLGTGPLWQRLGVGVRPPGHREALSHIHRQPGVCTCLTFVLPTHCSQTQYAPIVCMLPTQYVGHGHWRA